MLLKNFKNIFKNFYRKIFIKFLTALLNKNINIYFYKININCINDFILKGE